MVTSYRRDSSIRKYSEPTLKYSCHREAGTKPDPDYRLSDLVKKIHLLWSIVVAISRKEKCKALWLLS